MPARKKTEKLASKRLERLQVMLSVEELKAIDNFRFDKRMPSRAAAIRELLLRGLSAAGFTLAMPGRRSRDFGVLGDKATDDHDTESA